MSYIVTRTNGKVRQIWQDNEANWDFFMGGMSSDVHWQNEVYVRRRDRIFKTFDQAKWYLDTRAKHLRGATKKNDKEWPYHIEEVKE